MISKITNTIIALIATITSIMAQTPDVINYQGVAHNANGTAIANQAIKVRLKVHNTTAAGTVQYSEVRNVTTDASGLFNIQIGSAGAVSATGSWAGITWATGAKYLQVEMDPTGGTTYINMGTQQLVSVPYAQHAKSAASLTSGATISPSQIQAGGASANQVLQFDGTSWIPATISSGSGLALPYVVGDANLVSFGIANSSAVGGTAIYGQTTTNNVNANGVKGESTGTSGRGVYGRSAGTSAIGVFGENNPGTAVKGNTTIGTGLHGVATSGTALKGESTTGYALDVNGKIKIAGGNTSPSYGAVLTSDSSGNAKWKKSGIGFTTQDIVSSLTAIPSGLAYTRLHFNTEKFDLQNNYNLYAGSVNSNTSTFIAPANGIYYLGAECVLGVSNSVFSQGLIVINYQTSNNTYMIANSPGSVFHHATWDDMLLNTSGMCHLNQGDRVQVIVQQFNSNSLPANVNSTTTHARFYGFLLFAD